MFFYLSNKKFTGNLELSPLIESDVDNLAQVAEWAENKWGYIRKYPGIEKRKELILDFIRESKNTLFMVKYAEQAIGMFALKHSPNPAVKEFVYFYIAISFRSMGIGSEILTKAKEKAKEMGATMLVFETLNPHLNGFYKKNKGKEVCGSRFLKQPTTLFRMDTDEKTSDFTNQSSNGFAQLGLGKQD